MSDRRKDLLWLALSGVVWVLQVAYFLSPIDLIPDFIPIVGWVDDLAGLMTALGFMGWGVYKLVNRPPPTENLLPGARYGTEAYEPLSVDDLRSL